jgi:hypothetical protein
MVRAADSGTPAAFTRAGSKLEAMTAAIRQDTGIRDFFTGFSFHIERLYCSALLNPRRAGVIAGKKPDNNV